MSENPPDRLMLPAPAADAARKLDVDGPSVKLDDLGPMIVNSDGVRVTDWPHAMADFQLTSARFS